jgi:protein-S-isoprenylcysteine O-methyltransferase Ste14
VTRLPSLGRRGEGWVAGQVVLFLAVVVRHPIYGAGIVLALGWSLATSPLALLATVVLALFFELKSRREEAWLEERHPGYDAYRNRVRWRFIPGIR